MKKGENTILRDTLSLFLITLVAGSLLGLVYQVTKEPIRLAEERAKQEAYQIVFPEAASFEENAALSEAAHSKEIFSDDPEIGGVFIDEALEAVDGSGELLGYVLSFASKEGYGGEVSLSMGVDLSGTITGLHVLSMSETAGLGARCEEDSFTSQFAGIQSESIAFTKTGKSAPNEIDALSGATITTTAVTKAVNNALAFVYQNTEVTGEGAE